VRERERDSKRKRERQRQRGEETERESVLKERVCVKERETVRVCVRAKE